MPSGWKPSGKPITSSSDRLRAGTPRLAAAARRRNGEKARQCGNDECTCDDATGHGHMLRPLRRCGRGSQEAPRRAGGSAGGRSAAQAEQREHRAEIGRVDGDIRLARARRASRRRRRRGRGAAEHLEVVGAVADGDGRCERGMPLGRRPLLEGTRPSPRASTIGPSTRPVRRPSTTSRRLARQKSRPSRSRERVEQLVESAGHHADAAAGRVHAVDELLHAGRSGVMRSRACCEHARRRVPRASRRVRAGSRRSRARRASPAR